ncbi:MAG TPA: thiamine pyrophosphate-binding protein [Thermoanaerobaculia bacterium]|jgi:2-succinyl-5-enolpyruvyl-6-hydroxy-3-cyclohexene-1-carboxylate synthase
MDARETRLNGAGETRLNGAGVIDAVRTLGATEFCVCAGSRNSPLLVALGNSDATLFSFVDERAAAFFALGRIKLHGNPVAVVTTSGTAVAELLPATVEAYYSGLPLILVSADRPARYRGTGAPQSIEQVGIFGIYAETEIATWSRTRPLHLNVELEEFGVRQRELPLSDAAAEPAPSPQRAKAAALPPHSKPLIIIGGLVPEHRSRVREFVKRANAPAYAEALSGLREDPSLPLITAGERMIARAGFDSVIRIGNVPTLRFWRDLEERDIPVVHYSDLPFAGLTRGDVHPLDALPSIEGARDEAFFAHDREQAARFAEILDDEPQSELAMFRALSRELASSTRVYLGNSLPIREWDLAATREPHGFDYEANRGANGIDGQLSTFFGWCDPSRDNVCILGDLTTIYDLNAPWIVPQLGHRRFRIVVMNNGGGRIFSRVASLRAVDPSLRERIIENTHDLRFEHWAAMWNIDVTELRPDNEASRRAWARYDALWA